MGEPKYHNGVSNNTIVSTGVLGRSSPVPIASCTACVAPSSKNADMPRIPSTTSGAIALKPKYARDDKLHGTPAPCRSEEHTSELQSRFDLVCRLLLEKKKKEIEMVGMSQVIT